MDVTKARKDHPAPTDHPAHLDHQDPLDLPAHPDLRGQPGQDHMDLPAHPAPLVQDHQGHRDPNAQDLPAHPDPVALATRTRPPGNHSGPTAQGPPGPPITKRSPVYLLSNTRGFGSGT
ncbi:GL12816 [Drosophila persimilis]|uniref:GL12816 n=1 Tax=Drosophila persimilis TaxID=7234 RepID=B4IRQ1_DROPE|nr:GL12816 [Drosophila persimilis]